MKVSVFNGTPRGDKDLCASCRFGARRVTRGGRVHTRCHQFDGWVRDYIERCSTYQDRATPDLYELEKIAWVLRTDKKGTLGFSPIKDLDDIEKRKMGFTL